MTSATLLKLLAAMPAKAPLVFKTDQGEIRGGYHVTEFKLADIRSIDCGTHQSNWQEMSIQLLDGSGGDHMPVGKFQDILSRSGELVEGLERAPMQVEFAHNNVGMQLYKLTEPRLDGCRVTVDLTATRANCKPSQEVRSRKNRDALSCCGTANIGASSCCGTVDSSSTQCCA